MTTHALEEGYLRLLHAGPEWGESVLTNHGPMAVEILARRGHEDEIEPWLDDYLPRLSDLPLATSTIDPKEWREALGEGARVADWTEFFSRELKQMPWRDVLETWWPRLLPGMVAGTTHGVIRVSHAVRVLLSGQSDPTTLAELGHGLAFWAARFRGVPEPQDAEGSLQPGPAIDVLPRIPHQTGTVANRFGQLAALPEWSRGQANLARIETAEDAERLLTGLTDAATFRYVKHGHASPVLLVHTATAPNAVLHCLPALPQILWAPSARATWSVTAAIIACFAPAAGSPPPAPAVEKATEADPDAVASATMAEAVDHGDEHVIKFTDTALEVYNRTGDPAAVQAARHVAELIRSPRG